MTTTNRISLALSVSLLLVVPLVATAEPAPLGPVGVGAKVGLVLPQLATELDTGLGLELEASFALPPMERRLAVFLALGWTAPRVTRSGLDDPRLEGPYDGTQIQDELVLGLGVLGRILPLGSVWNGYGAIGARAYFLRTRTWGHADGAPFGHNRETSSRFGGVLALGGERVLWKGAAFLEATFGSSDLPHLISGDVATSAVGFQIGYRLQI